MEAVSCVIPPRFFKIRRNKCLVTSCAVTITKYIAFQFTRSLTELHTFFILSELKLHFVGFKRTYHLEMHYLWLKDNLLRATRGACRLFLVSGTL